MTFALVAHSAVQGTSGGTTAAVDTTGANILIAYVGAFVLSSAVVTDSFSNTWLPLTANTGGSSCSGQLFYAKNPTVGTGHTFTLGSVSFATLTISAFSGADTSSPFDVQSTGNTPGSGSVQPGSITPSNANSLIVCGCTPNDSSSGNPTVSSGFTITDSLGYAIGTAEGGAQAYQIQTTITAVNPTWSWGGPQLIGAACIAAFKPGGGPPPPTGLGATLLMMGIG